MESESKRFRSATLFFWSRTTRITGMYKNKLRFDILFPATLFLISLTKENNKNESIRDHLIGLHFVMRNLLYCLTEWRFAL